MRGPPKPPTQVWVACQKTDSPENLIVPNKGLEIKDVNMVMTNPGAADTSSHLRPSHSIDQLDSHLASAHNASNSARYPFHQ